MANVDNEDRAADFARRDEVHEEIIKDLRMLRQGICKRAARLNIRSNLPKYELERDVDLLVREDLKALH